jgi:hypothetical protein
MLKIYSQYFAKFLDSADKTPAAQASRFRYDYDTVVDDDGVTWGLEAVAKVLSSPYLGLWQLVSRLLTVPDPRKRAA